MKEHGDLYPEQYAHPLCGKRVTITNQKGVLTVERVVDSRFGKLAITKEHGGGVAWALRDVQEVDAR